MDSREKAWKESARFLAERDARLAPLIKKVGHPKLTFQADAFRMLCEAILSQQIAPKAAETIVGRFAALEKPFPKPASLLYWAKPRSNVLQKVGVSTQKKTYLVSLAEFWQVRSWRTGWDALSDEELIARLKQVKGIGTWTAQMFLIFSLGRINILPVDDYGVRRGLGYLLGLPETPAPAEIASLVSHWEGHYSVGCWYLWRALDLKLITAPSAEAVATDLSPS